MIQTTEANVTEVLQSAGLPLARWAREALLTIAAQQRGEE